MTTHNQAGYDAAHLKATDLNRFVGGKGAGDRMATDVGMQMAQAVKQLEEAVGAIVLLHDAGLVEGRDYTAALSRTLMANIRLLDQRVPVQRRRVA
jgi:hypothetical protein